MSGFICKKPAFFGTNITFTQNNSVRAVLEIFKFFFSFCKIKDYFSWKCKFYKLCIRNPVSGYLQIGHIFWRDMFFQNSGNIYYFHMVYQSTSSSEYLFFLFRQTFLHMNFIIIQLQLISLIITHQLHHFLSSWFISLSGLETSDSFHLASDFLAIYWRFLDAVKTGYRVQTIFHYEKFISP